MIVAYPGFIPNNPYAEGPEITSCIEAHHDVAIVLGCPSGDDGSPSSCQQERVEIALDLHAAGLVDRFIVTGNAVANAHVEAESLRALLLQGGVADADIFREPLANHTDENIYYSSRIMQAQGWNNAWMISDDPGHLIMTAVCDSNCCVELGRLTVFEISLVQNGGASRNVKIGHYVLAPPASPATTDECNHIGLITKAMCINQSSRLACADNFQLP